MSRLLVPENSSTVAGSTPTGGLRPTAPFTTPTKRAPTGSSGAARASAVLLASPAYASTLHKHSLYGTEDRIVIDPGSRIWKVGFSGESSPRRVFDPCTSSNASYHHDEDRLEEMWDIDFPSMIAEIKAKREEYDCFLPTDQGSRTGTGESTTDEGDMGGNDAESGRVRVEGVSTQDLVDLDILLRARLTKALRDTYHKHLLTDPRQRKVVVLENPLLPIKIKELIMSILFENLKVPSVSFAPHGLAALLAVGRTTGLVVDVGHLETTVLPIYGLRPLYAHLTTTPTAGRAYLRRLSALIHRFGKYQPAREVRRPLVPRKTRTGWKMPVEEVPDKDTASTEPGSRRVPQDLLTRDILEDIRIRACSIANERPVSISLDQATGFSPESRHKHDEGHLLSMEQAYKSFSPEPDCNYNFPSDTSSGNISSVIPASVTIPGWTLQAAGEIYFEMSDGDEESVMEAVLECLIKLPKDLRTTMVSSVLVSGGAGMVRGFIPRLRKALEEVLTSHSHEDNTESMTEADANADPPSATHMAPHQRTMLRRRANARRTQHRRPYEGLAGLAGQVAIMNDPAAPNQAQRSAESTLAGSAPRWEAHILGWVGGSIAGSLRAFGGEIGRETYAERGEAPISFAGNSGVHSKTDSEELSSAKSHLPDWSRPIALAV